MSEHAGEAGRTREACGVVVATGPRGLLAAKCGHLRPCAEHDVGGSLGRDNQRVGQGAPVPYRPPILADLLRHAAARRVLRDPAATDTERADARAVLGLPVSDNGGPGTDDGR